MANDIPSTGDGGCSTGELEIYSRSPNGQFLPRLDYAKNLLRSIRVTNVQINVSNPDPTPIIDALKALPRQMLQKELSTRYHSIVDLYSHYLHLQDDGFLKEVFTLCAIDAPKFESGLSDELAAIDLKSYTHNFELQQLQPLSSLCNAYLGLLTYNFHAMTVLYPDLAKGEDVIQGHVERAIESLRGKLRQTLRPNDRIKGSLLLEAFSETNSDRFGRYLQYEDRSDSYRGIQLLVAQANINESWKSEVCFEKPSVNDDHRKLADKLIELIDSFKAMLTAKQNYRSSGGGGTGFPIET
ncbi:hypothetical protein RA263_08485 [Pseudomonas syringae pv. tagetis]|uniref:Uncharacterized protein n=1 Tax=Pseudomonas syringae pv. tagetis TaxID=129140 RepID=A0A0Q0CLT0_9PSED|nr:hypothetical protein [Pseudomonas syringae group genomosp. 7]KPY89091.1 Uncharacterized protein ALO44_00526 [Pseudomonas syringae pv. tagetis]RMW15276.1 hypothetical protein ALO97_01326 [Pseudomonas syringae pv. tagetis]RMW19041.1 hypothetical protein ALO98_04032 [Pseudomonas syringae pv. tagetis]UNB66336.1 hypothetical protein MME58_13850 [Pseudomonas syringae pv. tagetis]